MTTRVGTTGKVGDNADFRKERIRKTMTQPNMHDTHLRVAMARSAAVKRLSVSIF